LSILKGGDDEEPEIKIESVIFLVDAGTEGFKGNIRVVTPGLSSCIDCNVELFPPEIKVSLFYVL